LAARKLPLALLALLAALAALVALAPSALADTWSPESGGSSNADDIDTLYWLVTAVAVVVFVGVEGMLIYCMRRFKARRGAVPAQIRGNTRLEIGWTLGAAAILVFLAVFTFVQLDDIRNPPASTPAAAGVVFGSAGVGKGVPASSDPAGSNTEAPTSPDGRSLNIEVNGQQYVWRYTYPDDDRNPLNNVFSYEELVVPTDTTVVLSIRAQDVAHSWWIPELGGKFDAVPGHTNFTWFNVPGELADRTFRGQCAELCGRNHANMLARVRAVAPRKFAAYIGEKRREIAESNRQAAVQRRQVEGAQQRGEEEPAGREPDTEETQ
jgi:cytochrome c oxidase subunit 2